MSLDKCLMPYQHLSFMAENKPLCGDERVAKTRDQINGEKVALERMESLIAGFCTKILLIMLGENNHYSKWNSVLLNIFFVLC